MKDAFDGRGVDALCAFGLESCGRCPIVMGLGKMVLPMLHPKFPGEVLAGPEVKQKYNVPLS
jgi:hypothetical protein